MQMQREGLSARAGQTCMQSQCPHSAVVFVMCTFYDMQGAQQAYM